MFSMQLPADQLLDQLRDPAPGGIQSRLELHEVPSLVHVGQAGQDPDADRGQTGSRRADGSIPVHEEGGRDMSVADEQQSVDGGGGG